MRQRILLKAIVSFAIAGSAFAMPQPVTLMGQETSGSFYTAGGNVRMVWKSCPGPTYEAPCVDPNNPWVIANGVTGSTATWTWDSDTGILASTGVFWTTYFFSSDPSGTAAYSDRVVDLVIDTIHRTTTATSYSCVDGVAGACSNTSTGPNLINESAVSYNVGVNASCVQLAIGGDDTTLGHWVPGPYVPGVIEARGLTTLSAGQAGPGCSPTYGAFDIWTTQEFSHGIPQLILSGSRTSMGFNPVPAPAVGWLLTPAFGLLGWRRRKTAS